MSDSAPTSPASTDGVPWWVPVAAGALIVVGAMGPWATVQTVFGSISKAGTDGDGIITAIAGALGAWASWLRRRRPYELAILCGAAAAGVGAYDAIDISGTSGDDVAVVSVGWGLWLTIVAGLALLGSAAVLRRLTPAPDQDDAPGTSAA